MNNVQVKKIISTAVCAVLSVLFIVLLFFCAPEIEAVAETDGSIEYRVSKRDENGVVIGVENKTAVVGEDVTAVRITDLGRLKKLTKVNYVADKFVKTGSIDEDIQIVDLTQPFEFAEKGTLIFVILCLDPYAQDFDEQTERLSEYKIGDNWCFTLSLPKVFCASNVYRKSELVARHGDIENYEFIDFTTSYDKTTDSFSAHTENTVIDLNFYTRRITMENALNAAQIITVHYQSTGGAYSGMIDAPLIGVESAVKSVSNSSASLMITFAVLAAVVLAVFIVLSWLKHTKEFVSAIVWIIGITLLLLSRYLLTQPASVPLFLVALWLSSSFVVLGGALLSVGKNFGKLPTKYVFPALAAVGALLAFICPFVPFGAAAALKIACTVFKAICAVALIAFTVISTLRKSDDDVLKIACATLIAVSICASLFMPQVFPAYANPLFWLCAATLITTFVGVFIEFKNTEKANEYLTTNLHLEVERQVKDIKAVIGERDKLLQFVSHDMKKPLVSSEALIDTLIAREKGAEQIKTLGIVKQNTARVVGNLSEIAVYAKFNYIAEPSQVADLSELCGELCEFHRPDCNANGIILKNAADRSVKAFVKKRGLESVVSNLIINAIEHADCKTVTVSIKTNRNAVAIYIADDGKGIDESLDVFRPYVSENNSETGGVGLYICKSIIESMNGKLTYESDKTGTAFCISLLKA